MKTHCRSCSRSDWLIPIVKNRVFTLYNTMDSSTTSNSLDVVDRVSTITTQSWPHYMVSATVPTSLTSVRATNGYIEHWIQIYYYSSLRVAPKLAKTLVSRLQNLSCGQCQRKSPTGVVRSFSTHAIWKYYLQDYLLSCQLFRRGSTHLYLIYELPRQLYSLYWPKDRIYLKEDIVPWKRPK